MIRQFFLASVLLGFLGANSAFAETKNVCTPLTLQAEDKNFLLPGPEKSEPAKVFVFKNISEQSLWLDHPDHASLNAGWSSYLRMNNSSALVLNRKNFKLSCAMITPGKVEYLDCEKVVSVCLLEQEGSTVKRKGTFWLAEDKPWEELQKLIEKRGVKKGK